ncbi:hypothetical protein CAMGR0001_1052 [Campylobacter gracilis RM3268]|uniref:Uncharacterized protein n=1 Tax=Campylobacter gracilis RM3268 TaxID=553220 RepID=C8PGQ7_9BACT|nr:hypothetical protein CAMGR0001_1052 [Campylobacter gracilis RM3268]
MIVQNSVDVEFHQVRFSFRGVKFHLRNFRIKFRIEFRPLNYKDNSDFTC